MCVCACVSISTHVNIQYMIMADMFAVYNLRLLCAFLWCCPSLVCVPPAIGGHIPGLAISVVGAKAGSEGLKCWDCSPCTTRLFSASCAARHFQTVPHSSKSNSVTAASESASMCTEDTDILDRACVRTWSACYGFAGPTLANLLDVDTESGTLLF